jgi:hypothetical protein
VQRFVLKKGQRPGSETIIFMKTCLRGFYIIIPFFVFLFACSKMNSGGSQATLTLSKSVVKLGEPLIATAIGQPSGSTIQWSASSAASIWSSGNSATFIFTSPGTHQIIATYYKDNSVMGPINPGGPMIPVTASSTPGTPALDSSQSSIVVTDSLYSDSGGTAHCNFMVSVPFKAGEQISLTPLYFSDSAGLVLMAQSKNVYVFSPALEFVGNFTGAAGVYEADFNGVSEFPCGGSDLQTPVNNDLFFSSLQEGTYQLVFKLNGTTYQGSMTVSNSVCSFEWDYSSGVTISPLQIQKQ